jgi:hypothetical protein
MPHTPLARICSADELADLCIETVVPQALSVGPFAPLDRELGPVLGMANCGIHNRQALRMWIRWQLDSSYEPLHASSRSIQTVRESLWSCLLPLLLQALPVANATPEVTE